MTEIRIQSRKGRETFTDGPAEAYVEITFEPGYAKNALGALARAVLDVLVEARKSDGTHG